jgi:glycolate oxidase
MDKRAIEICEAFARAGSPLDVDVLLIIEVEESEAEMDAQPARIVEIGKNHGVTTRHESKSALETQLSWKDRKLAYDATGRAAD